MEKIALDLTDRKILAELDKNCRIHNSILAKKVNKSREAVKYRIQQLQNKGIIQNFITSIDPNKLGYYMFKIYLKNKKIKNINMVGYVKPSLIQYYLAAADILVAPNSAKSDASMNYTSPLKLYEYMASRRPIILSDLTSMRNLIDAKFVFWMKPDDPKSLIDKIKEELGYDIIELMDYSLKEKIQIFKSYKNIVQQSSASIAKKKAQEAFSFVKTKTWDNRAEDILKYWNLI